MEYSRTGVRTNHHELPEWINKQLHICILLIGDQFIETFTHFVPRFPLHVPINKKHRAPAPPQAQTPHQVPLIALCACAPYLGQ